MLDFSCFEEVRTAAGNVGTTQAIVVNTRQLQIQLQQTQQLSDWYREQCVKQEEEISKLKEEGIHVQLMSQLSDSGACFVAEMSRSIFKERTGKINKRLELVNKRYEALEKRRNLEVQGYKSDMKLQREKLKDLEKRLCKVYVKNIHEYWQYNHMHKCNLLVNTIVYTYV